ncbi:hypothetical protein QMO56_25585 [Roseomonas sp. E05]|uniref:hypothetical protein n=1 Tax=Roseomonas sp. E05 TaxID=3046310 RepID=UPI0024B9011C|nr:hypothetical protein [Roseomonas sp. E05]MDJ0391479.1 hypothetical protein [Roseomonas sp. E05]
MTDPVSLPRLLTEVVAAERLGISIDTLRRERRRQRIGYTLIGGRPRYTERHLADYITANEVAPCAKADRISSAASGITGSPAAPTVRSGAAPGLIPSRDRRAAHLSALTILSKPSSRSRSGSR